ncbi:MAG: NRDE family protein [Deltaproteobacteria bacterium]|nr:NRDE family protein [Deltaproteobacteria bacterium]
MCTIALLVEVVAGAPIVVAANRDELYARPTRPPELLGAHLVGGRDVLSGGTWLAVHRDGRFAAVTNQRALATPPPGLRSRGLAVTELAAASDPDAYVAALDPTQYASMNLVWGDGRGVSVAYARQEGELEIERLAPGIHVLCNDRIGAGGFPRGVRLHASIAGSIGLGWPAIVPVLHTALSDHMRVPLAEVPPSHLPPELARELTATCIHSESYGTRSATLLALGEDRVIDYRYSEGPPCTSPLIDGRRLLEEA